MKPDLSSGAARRLTPVLSAAMGVAIAMGGWGVLGPGSAVAHPVADEMAKAAQAFLDSMDEALRKRATFEFKSDERLNWHFVPKERAGATLREMNAEQKGAALKLLATGLSHRGYEQATNIMSLESILAELEGPNRRFPRDPFLYHFLVFGKPDAKGTWGWRAEGHHFSASFTIINGELFASTPSFMGTNPAEVRKGPRTGLRVLRAEEDLARALIKGMNQGQQKAAVFAEAALKEIVTEAKRKAHPLPEKGIGFEALSGAQQGMLKELVGQYVNRVRPELAKADLARIDKAGWSNVSFAWAGGFEKGQGHYYRVQGPTFLLEYDNTQNDNNHIHAVWRDLENDFGEDLLRKHYRDHAHGN